MDVATIFARHLQDGYTEAYLWQQLFAAAYAEEPTSDLSDIGCQFFMALKRDQRVSPKAIETDVETAIHAALS